ncbi:MAG: VCBS repeat-containing protein [Alistipes sp.]|nr:VCBS repeat-containing protein [Alistipes sp.]
MKNISHLVLFILSIIVISCAKEETSYRITTAVSPASAGVVSPSSMEVSEGSSVSFTATPNDDYVFTGWSGSISGADNPLTVTITSNMNVMANFTLRSILAPKNINLKLPSSVLPFFYYGFNPSKYVNSSYRYLALDYNNDGYLDLITTMSDRTISSNIPIGFYLGQRDGSLIKDVKNHGNYGSTVWSRKLLYSDFNSDSYPDIFICAHGYDDYPWPCEEPILLLSDGNGEFTEKRYPEYIGFHHGGATGDIDNDGDVDILCSDENNSLLFINDGVGNFEITKNFINQELLKWKVSFEIYDINNDEHLDIIAGGHEWLTRDEFGRDIELNDYTNTSIIFWGNGSTNFDSKYDYLPKYSIKNGYGVVLDYIFYDINSDGLNEIIVLRTGDNSRFSNLSFYQGWAIQVLSYKDGIFTDDTASYIKGDPYNENDEWIAWIDIQNINGKLYLIATYGENASPIRLYELSNGKLNLLE